MSEKIGSIRVSLELSVEEKALVDKSTKKIKGGVIMHLRVIILSRLFSVDEL